MNQAQFREIRFSESGFAKIILEAFCFLSNETQENLLVKKKK